MKAVIGSAADLPFRDKEFEVVVASDVLEHVPPDLRKTVVNECLRVAQKLVIFGYPCGQLAWESDKALLQTYLDRKLAPPDWLSEHMDAPFPEADLMREISGWEVQQQANESIGFHTWLMKREISPTFNRFSSRIMRVAPGVTEFLLKKADRNPSYRQIFTLIRRETVEAR